jgi:hypothetical protein
MLNCIDAAWTVAGERSALRGEWGARFDQLRAAMESATGT